LNISFNAIFTLKIQLEETSDVTSVEEYNHFIIKDHQQQIQSSPKFINKLFENKQGSLRLGGHFHNADLTYD